MEEKKEFIITQKDSYYLKLFQLIFEELIDKKIIDQEDALSIIQHAQEVAGYEMDRPILGVYED